MQNKILPIVLPPALYRKLEIDGRAQERDAVQQARWLLKQALEPKTVAPAPASAAS